MIFKQALRRELSFTTGGVFLVLVTIMVTTLVIRILGFAANGAVNPEDALVLIALATLGYMAVLLTVSLFVATLIVLVRWYKDSEMIGSIQGFTYPFLLNSLECFFLKGADCWGWATWKDRWFDFQRDSKVLQTRISERNLERAFDLDGGYPYMQMLRDNQAGLNDSWAVRWHASNFIDNKLSLYPSHSLVNNTGDDGNGTHAGTSKGYQINLKNSELGNFPVLIRESFSARNKLIKFHVRRNRKYWLSQIKSAIKRGVAGCKDRW
jgi:hypothetical protein